MHKILTTMIASLVTAMLLTASPANATVYKFTFESFDSELTATGEITVNARRRSDSNCGRDFRPGR